MTEGAPQQLTDREIGKIVDSVKATKSESHPKTTIKERFTKRVLAAGLAGGIAFGAAGCSKISEIKFTTEPTTVTDVQSSETEPSVTTSENGTSVEVDPVVVTQTTETTSAPTETTVETTAPTETDITIEQKLQMAPEIEGAEKVIKEINGLERVIYERDGKYIGEYKKEVTQTDENGEVTEVGGIALIGSEVEKILNEQLPTAKDGYLMPLAADISDLTTLENVNLAINSEGMMFDGPYFIQISFGNETIDVTNVLPGETNMYQSSSMSNGFEINQTELCNTSSDYIEGKEMEFISVRAKFIDAKVTIINVVMGDILGKTSEPILESSVPGNIPGLENIKTQSFDNILKYEGIPVFVVSNN